MRAETGTQAGGHRQASSQTSRQTYWQAGGRLAGRDRQTGRQTQAGKQSDTGRQAVRLAGKDIAMIVACRMQAGRLADRQGRQTGRQGVRLAGKHIGRLTDKQCQANPYPRTITHMHASSSPTRSLQINNSKTSTSGPIKTFNV